MEISWESEISTLLTDLLAVQDELLQMLNRKRVLLAEADTQGLASIGQREEELIVNLQQCLRRREELLSHAAQQGLPSSSIRALGRALPRAQRDRVQEQTHLAGSRARLLKHQSLTNWVLIQRTLIHLSQMLEIVATGGRLQPTYGEGEPANVGGALVDRAG